jgi:predicted dinucleotide-binding enzyme
MRITIIGAGLMGRGIGTRAVAGGNDVELIDTDPEDSRSLAEELSGQGTGSATAKEDGSVEGEVVVLAFPDGAAADALAGYGDQLAGKVVVDITNPVDFASFEGLVVPPDSSAAEEIAKLVPARTPVVKAFNTTFGRTLVSGRVAGQQLEVLIAGDDEAAKERSAPSWRPADCSRSTSGRCDAPASSNSSASCTLSLQERLETEFGSAVKFIW